MVSLEMINARENQSIFFGIFSDILRFHPDFLEILRKFWDFIPKCGLLGGHWSLAFCLYLPLLHYVADFKSKV